MELRTPTRGWRRAGLLMPMLLAFLFTMNAVAIILRRRFERRW